MSIKSRLKKWLEIPDGDVVLVSDVRMEVAAAIKQAFGPDKTSEHYCSFFDIIGSTVNRHIVKVADVEFEAAADKACDEYFKERFEGEEFIDSVVERIMDKQLS